MVPGLEPWATTEIMKMTLETGNRGTYPPLN